MLLVLPIIAFVMIMFTLTGNDNDIRIRLIIAAVIWGLFVIFSTEILSLFNSITFLSVLLAWIILTAILIGLFFKQNNAKLKSEHILSKLSKWEWVLLSFLAGIVIVTGCTAIISPPNNVDSHIYHMARVMHWIQNQNVNNYPVNIIRQLYLNPGAEYALVHIYLLGMGDQFVNMLQWAAMVGCIIGVSLITKIMGAGRKGQLCAGIFAATIPMGILQSSSTQNDIVVSFWLICFVYFLLKEITMYRRKNIINLLNIFFIGGSLGLAFLTKGTGYIFAFPFLIWLNIFWLKEKRKLFFSNIVIFIIVATLNFGFFSRNIHLFGTLFGSEQSKSYSFQNESFSPPLIISNIFRNLSLHMGTPLSGINNKMENLILAIYKKLDINPNDPQTTWGGGNLLEPAFHIRKLSNQEDIAGNPIHLFLILFLLAGLLFRLRHKKMIVRYAVYLTAGFIFFCVLFRWQLWHSRLHLPVFILWSPIFGVFIRNKFLRATSIIILVLCSTPWIILNWSRPVVALPQPIYSLPLTFVNKDIYSYGKSIFNSDRMKMYFYSREIYNNHTTIINQIADIGCDQVGLKTTEEYPYWVLLKNSHLKNLRVESINVENRSSQYYSLKHFSSFSPCVIVTDTSDASLQIVWNNQTYTRIKSSGQINLYMKKKI